MHDPVGHISGAGGQIGPGGIRPLSDLNRPNGPLGPGAGPDGMSFLQELQKGLAEVNRLQGEADVAAEDLVAGRRDDLEGVMIATEKADTAFRMLLAVRNKMLDAYDEVKNLRV